MSITSYVSIKNKNFSVIFSIKNTENFKYGYFVIFWRNTWYFLNDFQRVMNWFFIKLMFKYSWVQMCLPIVISSLMWSAQNIRIQSYKSRTVNNPIPIPFMVSRVNKVYLLSNELLLSELQIPTWNQGYKMDCDNSEIAIAKKKHNSVFQASVASWNP